MKIGLDIHGVITKDPELWADITMLLMVAGHEIHIITGVEDTKKLVMELADYAISYNYLFSITSYHKSIGTHMLYKNGDTQHPLIAPPKWDCTKADYCRREKIDLHIDDSTDYGVYFRDNHCQYLIYNEGVVAFLKAITS